MYDNCLLNKYVANTLTKKIAVDKISSFIISTTCDSSCPKFNNMSPNIRLIWQTSYKMAIGSLRDVANIGWLVFLNFG